MLFRSNHLEGLMRIKAFGTVPTFLKIRLPEWKYFEKDEESLSELKAQCKISLDKATSEIFDSLLDTRRKIRDKLLKMATDDCPRRIANEAARLWMEAQGKANEWDHIYPCRWVTENDECEEIPLSAVVFRAAMQTCQSCVGKSTEKKRLDDNRKSQAQKAEQQRVQQIKANISGLPQNEAIKTH